MARLQHCKRRGYEQSRRTLPYRLFGNEGGESENPELVGSRPFWRCPSRSSTSRKKVFYGRMGNWGSFLMGSAPRLRKIRNSHLPKRCARNSQLKLRFGMAPNPSEIFAMRSMGRVNIPSKIRGWCVCVWGGPPSRKWRAYPSCPSIFPPTSRRYRGVSDLPSLTP